MNIHPHRTQKPTKKGAKISRKEILRFLIVLFLPVSLFLIAGRWDWRQAWIYIGLYLLSAFISRGIILRKYPDLIHERARFIRSESIKSWDRSPAPVLIYLPLLVLIVAALNVRYGWSPVIPAWLQWLSLAGIVTGLYILRTDLEDKTLSEELEGYAEYTRQARFRLLPGIWWPMPATHPTRLRGT